MKPQDIGDTPGVVGLMCAGKVARPSSVHEVARKFPGVIDGAETRRNLCGPCYERGGRRLEQMRSGDPMTFTLRKCTTLSGELRGPRWSITGIGSSRASYTKLESLSTSSRMGLE